MHTDEIKEKYTCLFGGGGARGFAYCGSLKALEELNIDIEMVGGSSVGAVFASLIAAGYNAKELKNIFQSVNFELFRDIHFGLGKDFALSKGEVFTNYLRSLLQAKVWENNPECRHKPVTFKDIKLPLVIITTNLSNFKCQEFSQAETPDYDVAKAVRISCSMPGLMTPFSYNDTKLVDGDLQKSMPMWKLSKTIDKNATRIIEFRLEGDYSGKEKSAIDFLNTIYSCMTFVGTEFLGNIYRKNDRYEFVKINTRSTIVVDFNMSKEARNDLMSIGYDDVMSYFKNFLPLKKRFLVEKYKTLFIVSKEIEHSILSNNAKNLKMALGELFIELADCRDNIDEKIYLEMQELKNMVKNSVSLGLFGWKISNKQGLEKSIRLITDLLNSKVKELDN